VGARRLWLVIAAAVTGSLLVSYVGIGVAAFILTLCALLLPLAYSVPPLRLKQRKWLGVFADAVAAHVYPAVLCLLIAGQRTALAAGTPLVVAVLLWSLMFGLRGILSHQLVDDDLDRASNLTTVVHDHGRDNMIRLLLGFIVPIEIACFVFAILQISPGAVFYSVVCVYLVFEALKVKAGWQSIIFTRGKLSAYLPFLNNSFYEVWGPLAAALSLRRMTCRSWCCRRCCRALLAALSRRMDDDRCSQPGCRAVCWLSPHSLTARRRQAFGCADAFSSE
jgi:hypothetical protein